MEVSLPFSIHLVWDRSTFAVSSILFLCTLARVYFRLSDDNANFLLFVHVRDSLCVEGRKFSRILLSTNLWSSPQLLRSCNLVSYCWFCWCLDILCGGVFPLIHLSCSNKLSYGLISRI